MLFLPCRCAGRLAVAQHVVDETTRSLWIHKLVIAVDAPACVSAAWAGIGKARGMPFVGLRLASAHWHCWHWAKWGIGVLPGSWCWAMRASMPCPSGFIYRCCPDGGRPDPGQAMRGLQLDRLRALLGCTCPCSISSVTTCLPVRPGHVRRTLRSFRPQRSPWLRSSTGFGKGRSCGCALH